MESIFYSTNTLSPHSRQIVSELTSGITHYGAWTAGITSDPDRRRGEHGNPQYWFVRKASSEAQARAIEKHLLQMGMKGDVGGGFYPTYIYIFLK